MLKRPLVLCCASLWVAACSLNPHGEDPGFDGDDGPSSISGPADLGQVTGGEPEVATPSGPAAATEDATIIGGSDGLAPGSGPGPLAPTPTPPEGPAVNPGSLPVSPEPAGQGGSSSVPVDAAGGAPSGAGGLDVSAAAGAGGAGGAAETGSDFDAGPFNYASPTNDAGGAPYEDALDAGAPDAGTEDP